MKTINGLVTEEQLKEWTGYKQRGALEKWLIENGIVFFHGKDNRICTTESIISESKAGDEIEVGF